MIFGTAPVNVPDGVNVNAPSVPMLIVPMAEELAAVIVMTPDPVV